MNQPTTVTAIWILTAVLLIAALLPKELSAVSGALVIAPALADDDDDDDDDDDRYDDDDDDDDDDDRYDDDDDDDDARRRPRVRTRAPAPRRPTRAAAEIVAAGLTDAQIVTLTGRGYQIIDRRDLQATDVAVVRFRVPRGVRLEAARTEIGALSGATADFNHFYRPQQQGCSGPVCRAHRLVGWPPGTALRCGATATIGMIDTGINIEHAALADRDIEIISLRDGKRQSPGRQHGTAVAALLVGAPGSRAPGLLPDAKLIAVDAFHRGGRSDDRIDAYDLVRSIDALLARDVPVINLSLAGPANAIVKPSVDRALARGVTVVAAAGNVGPDAPPAYPAAYDGVIAVTAVDLRLRVYRRAGRGRHIDFAAPGVGVWTAASVRGRRPKTGTSFAAPFVSAAAAVLSARQPGTGDRDRIRVLTASARDLGPAGHDPIFGWGLLQAADICKLPANAQ